MPVRKLKLEELGRSTVEEFRSKDKLPVSIIVDNFRSGLNVGSIFRSADAFLIEKIYLCGITSTPPHKEILKTAIGANHAVDWVYVNEASQAVRVLKNEDHIVIGIEQTTASEALSKYKIEQDRKYAIILGNEVEGISDDVLPLVDVFLEIPQHGTKHSLNVSVCAGIVMNHFAEAFAIV